MPTNEVMLDFQRGERIGFDEAILCQGKTTEHLTEILATARANSAPRDPRAAVSAAASNSSTR